MITRHCIFSLFYSATLFVSASIGYAQDVAAPIISPHCQKMMMIGCALTKGGTGRNAKVADKECADLLSQGECTSPLTSMPEKIIPTQDASPDIAVEEQKPVSLRDSYAPATNIGNKTENTKASLEKTPNIRARETDEMENEIISVPPKELIDKTELPTDSEVSAASPAEATVNNPPQESELQPAPPVVAVSKIDPPVKTLEPIKPAATPLVELPKSVAEPATASAPVASSNPPSKPEITATIPAPSFADEASILQNTSDAMTLSFGTNVIIPDQPNTVTMYLRRSDNNSPVTYQDLKEVHTQKLHVLIIDPTLKEFHHVFPSQGAQAGEYNFTFTPTGSYFKVFADVTTIGNDKNSIVSSVLGVKPIEKGKIDTVTRYESSDGINVSAVLSFDTQPKSSATSTGKIHLVDNSGTPIKNLEPVMGSFGHIVGFPQDLSHALIMHPIGADPISPMDRGGSELMFHFAPQASGFIRLFAQVKIGGKDIYIPFGFTVN